MAYTKQRRHLKVQHRYDLRESTPIFQISAMIQNLRKEDVPIAMRGSGVRRLWNPDTLRIALLNSDEESVDVVRLDERRDSPEAA